MWTGTWRKSLAVCLMNACAISRPRLTAVTSSMFGWASIASPNGSLNVIHRTRKLDDENANGSAVPDPGGKPGGLNAMTGIVRKCGRVLLTGANPPAACPHTSSWPTNTTGSTATNLSGTLAKMKNGQFNLSLLGTWHSLQPFLACRIACQLVVQSDPFGIDTKPFGRVRDHFGKLFLILEPGPGVQPDCLAKLYLVSFPAAEGLPVSEFE